MSYRNKTAVRVKLDFIVTFASREPAPMSDLEPIEVFEHIARAIWDLSQKKGEIEPGGMFEVGRIERVSVGKRILKPRGRQ